VFPRAEGLQNPDPTKPMSGWGTAWRNLTRAVQCPACGLLQKPGETCRNEECAAEIRALESSTAGLRFHDLRHHRITELAESQTVDQVIMSIAGHVSGAMLRHYSHVRLGAKRRALDALSSSVPTHVISAEFQGRSVTNPVTIEGKEEKPALQTAEKIGGRDRDRTGDLLVANSGENKLRQGATIT